MSSLSAMHPRRFLRWVFGFFVLLAAAPLHANITTSLVSVANGLGSGTATYDLRVTISFNDDWTSTSTNATLSGTTFFEHPLGSNTQPDPVLFTGFPTLQWDTFVTSPGGWPNTQAIGIVPGFAASSFSATEIKSTWFDTSDTGDGTWTIARFSIQGISGPWQLTLQGAHTVKSSGQLFPYAFQVPEPSGFFMLPILALARLTGRGAR